MFEILAKGGPVIIPLLLCSLAAVAVAVERGFFFYRLGKSQRELLAAVEESLNRKDFPAVLEQCRRLPSPLAAILRALVQNANPAIGEPPEGLPHGAWPLTTVFAEAARSLERFLPVLDTVVTAAPLLGLLGTVTGMIKSFGILSLRGIGHPTAITGGVAEALIATALGLAIAIFSLFFFNLYQARAEAARAELEAYAQRFLTWLKHEG